MSLLALAERVAREAGVQLLEAYAGPAADVQSKSTSTDLVSAADHAAEELIRSRLAAERPDDGILGEEGADETGSSGLRWVVDPLDGTVNFLFGIPQWAVSIAVEDAEGVLAGVVYDPPRDELWAAERGGDALLDGRSVRCSARTSLAEALIVTGFGYDPDVRAAQAATVAALLPKVRDIRRFGSAALDLVWTAAGRYDGYYERGIHHWDVAAGGLICERAGLVVEELPAAPPQGAGILAATPAIFGELQRRVG